MSDFKAWLAAPGVALPQEFELALAPEPRMKVVLLNGPPRSGKDTAAALLCEMLPGAVRIGFADHLKRATHAAYGLPMDPISAYEAVKEKPSDEFFGISPRQAYIEHSERYMKPAHGNSVFGHLFMRAARASGAPIVVVPDSGFMEEAQIVADEIGAENVLLIRIHAMDRGCSFKGDSRSYIEVPGVDLRHIFNNASLEDFKGEIAMVADWVREMTLVTA